MPSPPGRMSPATLFWALLLIFVAVFAWMLIPVASKRTESHADLPPIESVPFRNTSADGKYVGMQRCQTCHPDEHQSYLETGHSQALAEINLEVEPANSEFYDSHSQRHYRIYRHNGKMRHEESIRTSGNQKLILADYAMRYVIGSGRFSRSYLIERDGFLFESPATWYAARPGWSLSPGFDTSNPGFQRSVELRCLTCHAGRVEPIDRSPQQVKFHALSIDCERCHGPGSLHVEKHESSKHKVVGSIDRDDTIVNPIHLDREHREDICAQCHLHSAATVELRGRSLLNFRPGQRLADYVVHYALQGPKQQMEVVGHVEQLHLSRCYTNSTTLTCTTCHDPHAKPAESSAETYYRGKCLECHNTQTCSQPIQERLKHSPSDNCVTCHMPNSQTEIPHFAFTHHRIGKHSPHLPNSPIANSRELIQIGTFKTLSSLDESRNLGLAYLQLSDGPGQAFQADGHRARALDILRQVKEHGMRDVEVEASLARLYWGTDPRQTIQHARLASQFPDTSPDAWATICFTLGSTLYGSNQPAEAIPWLEKTLKARPTADVWYMLSDSYLLLGERQKSVWAAQQASELAPDRPRYLQHYANLVRTSDQPATTAISAERIRQLILYRSRVDRQLK